MYESFYGFREKPFSLLPDPEFLYLGARHKTALSLLEYGILNQAGFIVITGETGMGKTTLLRKVLTETQPDCTAGLLASTHGGGGSLMPWILMAFGLSWRGKDPIELFQTFAEFLAGHEGQSRRVILIVDEAQSLAPPMLEELRLLSNVNADKQHVFQVILSGQPGLRTLLQRPDLTQFAQRVAVDYTLEPMDERETQAYIRHRITVAGGDPSLFSDRACLAAHRLTGGVPRLLNQVCDLALSYGYAEQAGRITGRLVVEAARDRSAGCILPLVDHLDMSAFLEEDQAERPVPANGHVPNRAQEPVAQPVSPMRASETLAQAGGSAASDRATLVQPAAAVGPGEWLRRGQVLRKRGRHKDAIRSLQQAAQDQAFAFKAYSEMGLCCRDAGRPKEAIEAFRSALADKSAPKPERVAVCYELGRTYQSARMLEQALECYRKVHRVDPSFQDVARRIERLSGAPPGDAAALHSERTNGSWVGQTWGRLQQWLRVGR